MGIISHGCQACEILSEKFYLLSVDDVVLVEVFEGEQNICRVEGGILEFESLTVTNVEVKLAPVAIIQHEVQSLEVFEGVFEPHNEGVLHSLKNTSLGDRVLDLAILTDALFL